MYTVADFGSDSWNKFTAKLHEESLCWHLGLFWISFTSSIDTRAVAQAVEVAIAAIILPKYCLYFSKIL